MTPSEQAYCLNCGTAAGDGPYCTKCGQQHSPQIQPVWSVVKEAIDEAFSVDSKLFRSVFPLFFKPGFLTREYLAGRRMRYVSPLRLYLICSLTFFLTYAVVPDDGFVRANLTVPDSTMIQTDSLTATDLGVLRDLRASDVSLPTLRRIKEMYARAGLDSVWTPSDSMLAQIADDDSLRRALDLTEREEFWEPFTDRIGGNRIGVERVASIPIVGGHLQSRARRLNQLGGAEFRDLFNRTVLRHFPKMVFALLPLFAFALKILYVRRSRMYTEHFIFALHLHAFAFLLFIGSRLTDNQWIELAIFLVLQIYIFIAWRKVYGQGFFKTTLKMGGAYMVYFFFFLLGLVGVGAATLLTM